MVGAIQSHSCLGSCRALLSFQTPRCAQTHLDMATWTPASRGGRPGLGGSAAAAPWKEEGRLPHGESRPPEERVEFSSAAIIKGRRNWPPLPLQPQCYNSRRSLFLSLLFPLNHDNKHSSANNSSVESYSRNFTLITPHMKNGKELC